MSKLLGSIKWAGTPNGNKAHLFRTDYDGDWYQHCRATTPCRVMGHQTVNVTESYMKPAPNIKCKICEREANRLEKITGEKI